MAITLQSSGIVLVRDYINPREQAIFYVGFISIQGT
jgi:hypothetical protein